MKHFLLSLAVLAFVACGPQTPGDIASDSPESPWETQQEALTVAPAGSIPAGMPARLAVGLFEEAGDTWMKQSGVPWDVRYRYLTKGWVNNWGWSPSDGSWAMKFLQESVAQNSLPAVQYYQMNAEPGGGEAQFLAKAQNATTMKSYFSDFKVLMQRAKELGKPVLVLMEADGYGLLQQQSGNNPNVYAAVKATGLPELAGLPDTVAGWSLAFLQLRKAVGANNVILGMHISGWASTKDIAYFSVTEPLQPEVDKVYNFLKPLGLGSNVTGATYDVLVGDPLDRDSDFYKMKLGQTRWWDPSDTASINSSSFNRYAEWLRLWNVASGKRWVLWQIPEGNSNSMNVDNTSNAPRAGYKDNRSEYFFGTNSAPHRERFANAGVIALLFGRGEGRQASHKSDVYTDGQLYLQSRAGAFLKAGGMAIPSGSSGTVAPTPTPSPTPTPTPTPTPVYSDTAPYNFEAGMQGWALTGTLGTSMSTSSTRAFSGSYSLAASLTGSASGKARIAVGSPSVPAGRTVSFKVWIPTGSTITAVQPYVQQGSAGGWTYTSKWVALTSLTPGAWNTVSVTVPSNAVSPLHQLGVEVFTNAAWSGPVHVDSVSW